MIELKIACHPWEVDDHMNALGFVRMHSVRSAQSSAKPLMEEASPEKLDNEIVPRTSEPEPVRAALGVMHASNTYTTGDTGESTVDLSTAKPGPAPTTEPAAYVTGTPLGGTENVVQTAVVATRKPGEPSPGRKRRTAEEVAEDKAFFAARADEVKTAISTGELRVGPDDPRDAEDEAAETAGNTGKPLTLDDVRATYKRYSDAVGMPTAIATIRGIVGGPIADIPPTQEALAIAIGRINAAVGDKQKPYTAIETFAAEAEKAAAEPASESLFDAEPAKPARVYTRQDVMMAGTTYAIKYDGQGTDSSKMPNAKEDFPRIVASVFEGVYRLDLVPQTPESFEKLTKAINDAIVNNPYGRKALK